MKSIYHSGQYIDEAVSGQSIVIELYDEVDCDEGSIISPVGHQPNFGKRWFTELVWFDDAQGPTGQAILQQKPGTIVSASLSRIYGAYDLGNLELADQNVFGLNDIGRVRLETYQDIAADAIRRSHSTGSFILIQIETNKTAGAGFFREFHKSTIKLESNYLAHSASLLPYREKIYEQNRNYYAVLIEQDDFKQLERQDRWWLKLFAAKIKLLTNVKRSRVEQIVSSGLSQRMRVWIKNHPMKRDSSVRSITRL